MGLTSAERRRALGIIEQHGALEGDPEAGVRLAAGLEALLEADPLVNSIDTLSSAVGALQTTIQLENRALRVEVNKENAATRAEVLAEQRAFRGQLTILMVLMMGLNSALVGIGMSWNGGTGLTITPTRVESAEGLATDAMPLYGDDDGEEFDGHDTGPWPVNEPTREEP